MIGAKQIAFFRLALRNLLGYPMRTFLTALGVIFGVGSVIAMLALGVGAEKELLEEIGRLGIQNIINGGEWTVRIMKTVDRDVVLFQFVFDAVHQFDPESLQQFVQAVGRAVGFGGEFLDRSGGSVGGEDELLAFVGKLIETGH